MISDRSKHGFSGFHSQRYRRLVVGKLADGGEYIDQETPCDGLGLQQPGAERQSSPSALALTHRASDSLGGETVLLLGGGQRGRLERHVEVGGGIDSLPAGAASSDADFFDSELSANAPHFLLLAFIFRNLQ